MLKSNIGLFLSELNKLHPGSYLPPNNKPNPEYYLEEYLENIIEWLGNQTHYILIIWYQLHPDYLVLDPLLDQITQYTKLPQPNHVLKIISPSLLQIMVFSTKILILKTKL